MANDFFVRFGSDAARFGKQLDADLAQARRAVGTFAKQLQDLETTAANRRAATMKHLVAMTQQADAVQKRLDSIGVAHERAGINPEVADVSRIAREASSDMASFAGELDGILRRMDAFVISLDRTSTAGKAARAAENRTAGQQRAAERRERDPATGRLTATGSGVPFKDPNFQAAIAGALKSAVASAGQVQIGNIPQATIDEAAFQRVVSVMEQNLAATRAVEAAVDRVGAKLGDGGGGVPDTATTAAVATAVQQQQKAVQTGVGTPAGRGVQLDKTIATLSARERELRQDIERLAGEMQAGANVSQVFGRSLNELAEVEKKLASAQTARANDESRAAQQERQRRDAAKAAAAQSGITITPEERRFRQNERARLELAASPEALQAQKPSKAALVEIAQTLGRQGYPVELGSVRGDTGLPRASIAEITKQVTAAGREYLATGRATADDLSSRRVSAAPAEMSADLQQLLGGDLPRVAQRFNQELGRLGISVEQAYRLIGANLRSGGTDPRKYAKGRQEVGAEIGDELRGHMAPAADAIAAYERERRAAARSDVIGQMRGNQTFNPYEADRAGSQGRTPEAQQIRRDMAALLSATQEVDEFATNLGKLDDGLRRAQQVQERVLRALDSYERLKREPTPDEAAEYTRNLGRAEAAGGAVAERRARLQQEMSLWKDPQGGSAQFLLEPGFRSGLERRQESRSQAEAEAERTRSASQERFAGRQALQDAVSDYFGGARTFATTQGNTRDYFTRNLPGVQTAGGPGRQRLAFSDDAMMGTPENRKAIQRMTAGMVGYAGRLYGLIDEMAAGESSEEQLTQTRQKVIAALNRLLGGYQSAFPNAQVPDMGKFLPPALGFDNNFLDQAAAGDQQALAEVARQNKSGAGRDRIAQIEADAAKAYADPKRSQQLAADLAKSIRAQIKAVNQEIKSLGDSDKARRDVLIAEREQLRAARKRATGRVDPQDLEAMHAQVIPSEEGIARATQQLEQRTTTLSRIRAELAQREEFARQSLSPQSASAYDVARGRATELRSRIGEIETGSAIRADREEGALDPASMKAAEAARAELGRLKTQLGAVNSELRQYERLAHSVNPQTAFGLARKPGDMANIQTEGLEDSASREQARQAQMRVTVNELEREADRLRAALATTSAAFRDQQAKRGDRATRDPEIPGFGGGGAGAGGGDTALGGADGAGGGRQGILQQILATLNRIDGRLKGTLKVTGNVTTAPGGAAGTSAARQASRNVDLGPRSSEAGRADFEQSISQSIPAVGQYLAAGKDVQAAAELIQSGVMSETRVFQLFRDRLAQTSAEAKKFAREVRSETGNARLKAAADAAALQKQRQDERQFTARTGETMDVTAAKRAMTDDLAARKRKAEATRKSAAEERIAAAAALTHAQAMARLSDQTKVEIAELERMARSTDRSAEAQARLAAQMAKVYGMAAQNMRGRAVETNQAVGQIYKAAGIDVGGEEVAAMRNTARSLGHQVDQSAAQGVMPGGLFGGQSEFTQAMFGNAGFWSRVMHSTGTFVVRNFTAGFVFGLTAALQDLLTQAIQAEAIFVRVSDALEETGQSTQGLRTDLRGLAVEYGVGLQDVYETAAGLTGLFSNKDELVGGVEVVTQLQRISMGALNAKEAMGVLSAVIGGFGAELGTGLDAMTHVADVLTTIQNNLGVNVEVAAEGVGRMAGLAQTLKIDFEDAAVYVSQIAKLTNQTGAAAGEQFSRVLAVMQTGRGRQVLTENLPDTGIEQQLAGGEYGQALNTLLENWNDLTDAQKRNITVTLGGQRQAATLGALLNDSAKVLETTAKAHDANGEAAKRNDEIMKTMNAQIGVLMANFTALADNLLDSGIANSIGVILGFVNLLLSGVNKVLGAINDLAETNAFTKTLLEWGLGLAGFIIMLGVLGKSLAAARASMAAMRSFAIADAAAGGVGGAAGAAGAAGTARSGWQTIVSGPAAVGTQASRLSSGAADRASAAFVRGNNLAAGSYLRVSQAANGASRISNGLATGLNKIGSAGITAQIGMALAAAAIITLISDVSGQRGRDAAFRAQVDKQRSQADGAETDSTGQPYVGPFTQGARENRQATGSYFSTVKSLVTAPFKAGNAGDLDSWLDMGHAMDRIQGILPEDMEQDLTDVHQQVLDRIREQSQVPVQTAEAVEATNNDVSEMLKAARDEIINGGGSDQQKQSALAELEQYSVGFEGIVTKLRLKAEGVILADQLSTDQIKEISTLTSLLQSNLASGNAQVAEIAQQQTGDLGLTEGSTVLQNLQKLSEGGINSAEAMKLQAENISIELENANAKYRSMVEGVTPADSEQIEEQHQVVLQKASELMGATEGILSAIISDATGIAALYTARGQYGGAATAMERALQDFHATRSPGESDVTRAANDLIEGQGAEQIASQRAATLNQSLETAKARGGSAQDMARIEQEIARNNLTALLDARRAATSAGLEGPSVRSIRDAKNAWLTAQRQSFIEAQNANIAGLALQAAGEWNALAAAGFQEQIALQQYKDAKQNFGAGSTEALNAQAGLLNAQKSTQQTQDQIAAAQRDAMLASIPQGNTMAISQQTLANAQAALAAAEKYGQNSTEYLSALSALRSAQQNMVQTEAALIQSRTQVAIALAQAAGNTVKAARLQVTAAQQALNAALKNSGGAASAEVNQARASLITAQAGARDARLQDSLDTIDFNLQMGKITQSSAISSLRQILRNRELTKAQRRQLLLQIKGMQESLSDGAWNFGDIKMPAPYQMRRYIERNRKSVEDAGRRAGQQFQDAYTTSRPGAGAGGGGGTSVVNSHNTTTITITAGTDVKKVEEVVRRAVGEGHRTRTAQPRRR